MKHRLKMWGVFALPFVALGIMGYLFQTQANDHQDDQTKALAAAITKIATENAKLSYQNSLAGCQRGNHKVYRPLSDYYAALTSPEVAPTLPPGVVGPARVVSARINPVNCKAVVKKP